MSDHIKHLEKMWENSTKASQGSDFVSFADGTHIERTAKSIKIFEEGFKYPLVRLDSNANHRLPENHIQFGDETYTGRSGEEAKDLFNHILLTKLGVDMFKK